MDPNQTHPQQLVLPLAATSPMPPWEPIRPEIVEALSALLRQVARARSAQNLCQSDKGGEHAP